MGESPEQMWRSFLAFGHRAVDPAASYTSWYFGSPDVADELARLVLEDRKRATTGSLWSYEAEGEPLPQVGDFSVVTGADGRARCVIRTTEVRIVPFHEVDVAFARDEGEGDLSLAYWREVHWAVFDQELGELGRRAAPDMPLVCERFEVVYPPSVGSRRAPRRGSQRRRTKRGEVPGLHTDHFGPAWSPACTTDARGAL